MDCHHLNLQCPPQAQLLEYLVFQLFGTLSNLRGKKKVDPGQQTQFPREKALEVKCTSSYDLALPVTLSPSLSQCKEACAYPEGGPAAETMPFLPQWTVMPSHHETKQLFSPPGVFLAGILVYRDADVTYPGTCCINPMSCPGSKVLGAK